MDHALLRACHKLDLALKQTEGAQNNLLGVERWAHQHNHPHLALDLALGTRDLGEHLGWFRLAQD